LIIADIDVFLAATGAVAGGGGKVFRGQTGDFLKGPNSGKKRA